MMNAEYVKGVKAAAAAARRSKTLGDRLVAAGHEDILLADGFEDAFMGLGHRCGQPVIAIYDRRKCIKNLMKDMTREEAEEYFEFNVVGAWVGEKTPLFLVVDKEI